MDNQLFYLSPATESHASRLQPTLWDATEAKVPSHLDHLCPDINIYPNVILIPDAHSGLVTTMKIEAGATWASRSSASVCQGSSSRKRPFDELGARNASLPRLLVIVQYLGAGSQSRIRTPELPLLNLHTHSHEVASCR